MYEASGDVERAEMHTATQCASNDSSSGDSCWVRQYLEWCDDVTVRPEQGARPLAFVVKEALASEATSHVGRSEVQIGEWPNDKSR